MPIVTILRGRTMCVDPSDHFGHVEPPATDPAHDGISSSTVVSGGVDGGTNRWIDVVGTDHVDRSRPRPER
jgi:hypothetical protein